MSAARLVSRAKKSAEKKAAKKKAAAKVRAYRHDHTRVNIPHAGTAHKIESQNNNTQNNTANAAQNNHDPHLHPTLQWAGRQNAPAQLVNSQPLHVHERVDPAVIIRATLKKNGNGQPPLFESPEEKLTLKKELEFYQHQKNWTNRLIAGDSAIVMKSLVQKEGMGGKVQCVYMDPPYGIKYGSNFQPFVNKREVKDKKDADLTTEPEMIRAFRDTWEFGIHSYLSHLRDRLALCRELLNDSGSCFVQISDRNVHLVRCVMDEIFGMENSVATIAYKVTSGFERKIGPRRVHDFILWYAKQKENCKFNRLFKTKNLADVNFGLYKHAEDKDGTVTRITPDNIANISEFVKTHRIFRTLPLHTMGTAKREPRTFNGEEFVPPPNCQWRQTDQLFKKMVADGRIMKDGNRVQSISYHDDFPYEELSSMWGDTGPETRKGYVVQTSKTPIQRCVLATTDPGDLVLDPTCGSGTTAYVAEQWGRRWITCDTSRVALALARQRLMTAKFDYYKLRDEKQVSEGFVCKTAERVTLKSATSEEVDSEIVTLHDQPEVDASKARVTGPFTVEAVPSPVVQNPDAVSDAERTAAGVETLSDSPGSEESRRGETHRQALWRERFEAQGVRLKNNRRLKVRNVRVFSSSASDLHATFVTREDEPRSGFVSFGPEDSPLGTRQVLRALDEAEKQRPSRALIVFAAFEFDPEAARVLDEGDWARFAVLKAKMSPDLQTADLRGKGSDGDSFWLVGRPDAELRRIESGEDAGKWVVSVRGFDYYDPVSGEMRSGDAGDIAMWMLDPDYDTASVYPRQVFFPLSEGAAMWRRLARDLNAEVDADLMEKFTGRESLPFELSAEGPGVVAVKIVDNRGIESLRILRAER